jgi:CubicO group peptidase (beta-lactamase class C family)
MDYTILLYIIANSALLFSSIENKSSMNNAILEEHAGELLPCILEDTLDQESYIEVSKKINKKTLSYQLDTFFTNKAKWSNFNGSVLIEKNGVILYNKTFGIENNITKIPLSADSKFQLASISKQFTACAILQLVQAKKIDLNATVDKYIPGFPYAGVTVQSLLCHRSGLPEYMHVFSTKIKDAYVTDNDEVLDWFAKEKPVIAAKPNTKFAYCNTNYLVLASIVEKVSGQDFASYMRKNIFLPLGMVNSFIITTDNENINTHRTTGYTGSWQEYKTDFFDGVVGDKGVYTTTHDMLLWSKAIYSECFIDKSLMTEAFMPRSFEKPGEKNYGYGFRLLHPQSDTNKIVYHNGWWKGYNTCFYTSPYHKYTIIVFSNKYTRTVYAVQPVVDILLGVKSNEVKVEEGAD